MRNDTLNVKMNILTPNPTNYRYPIGYMKVGDSFTYPKKIQPRLDFTVRKIKHRHGKILVAVNGVCTRVA